MIKLAILQQHSQFQYKGKIIQIIGIQVRCMNISDSVYYKMMIITWIANILHCILQ